jgi:hypothetical protein
MFAVDTVAAVLFAVLSLWLVGLADGHWWRNALAIFLGVILLLFSVSAGMALFDRKAPTS